MCQLCFHSFVQLLCSGKIIVTAHQRYSQCFSFIYGQKAKHFTLIGLVGLYEQKVSRAALFHSSFQHKMLLF